MKNYNNSGQSFVSLVSFFGQISELIYQADFLETDKTNEIKLIQELAGKLQINKVIFTMDVLHCQTQTTLNDIYSWNQTGHDHDSQCRIKIWPAGKGIKKWP